MLALIDSRGSRGRVWRRVCRSVGPPQKLRKTTEGFEPPSPEKPCPYNVGGFTTYSYPYQARNEAGPGEYLLELPKYVEHLLPQPGVIDWLAAALDNYGNVPDIRPD
jgi:hypothetical protein